MLCQARPVLGRTGEHRCDCGDDPFQGSPAARVSRIPCPGEREEGVGLGKGGVLKAGSIYENAIFGGELPSSGYSYGVP